MHLSRNDLLDDAGPDQFGLILYHLRQEQNLFLGTEQLFVLPYRSYTVVRAILSHSVTC